MSTEIKQVLENLEKTHGQLLAENEKRDAELKAMGGVTQETENKVSKLVDEVISLTKQKADEEKRLADLEMAVKRGLAGGKSDAEVKAAERSAEVKAAFNTYYRKCDPAELKALSVNSEPDGGFTVEDDMSGRIARRVFDTSPMRQVASVQRTDKQTLTGIYDIDELDESWETEEQATTNDKTPKIGKWTIPVHRQRAEPKATEEVLEDSSIDLEGWLVRKISDKLTRSENAAFINGDGIKQPRGILTYEDGTTWGTIQRRKSGVANGIGADAIVAMPFDLQTAYRANGRWGMARATLADVMLLKDAEQRYFWQPSFQQGQPSMLQGFPVMEFDDMPAANVDGNLAIAFGDFAEAYQIVDRTGVSILRDPFTGKPYVKFYARKRVGGDVINFDAIKLMEIGA